jgi:hypothetical protein
VKTSSCKRGRRRVAAVDEARRDNDPSAGEVDRPDAGLDERQHQPRIELQDVVRRILVDLGDAAQLLAALLLDPQADELEDVVGVLVGRRQLAARHGERRAALHLPVEPDHRPALRAALRRDDLVLVVPDADDGAHRERAVAPARAFDEERPVESVRASDLADRDELRAHAR